MSLVEEAMRKLQQTQRTPTGQSEVGSTQPGRATSQPTASTSPAAGSFKPLTAVPSQPRTDRVLTITRRALQEQGLVAPAHEERRTAQQYRQIKRPLIANAMGRGAPRLPNGNLIMVASAVPGEGKTFTSLNLALSMTLEKDMRVLLVDADLPKPHLSTLLGAQGEPGLLEALRESSLDIEGLILPTTMPGLSVLPAGQGAENATELLASEHMRTFCARLSEQDPKRVILFDSPPLLLTTESQALAQVVGQIVVVVRADNTPHRTVLDALHSLGNVQSVSLILNQSTVTSKAGDYYYYGYGANQAGAQKNT